VVQRIGARNAYRLAGLVAKLMYGVATGRRAAFKRELDFVMGRETGDEESRTPVRDAFRILVCNEIEVLLFPVLDPRNISRFVRVSGIENLEKGLSAGKGVLLLFGHFGANQMIMPAIGHRGYKMSQLSAPPTVWQEKLPNKKFTAMGSKALDLRWAHEQALPVTHINIFGSLRQAFECLKRNEILGVAMDGGGGANRLTAEMLGRRAAFSNGSVQLAMRTGCAVLPAFMVREQDGPSRLIIEAPVNVVSREENADAETRNLQAFVQRFEHYVRQYPSHYLPFLALRRFMAEQGDDPLFPGDVAGARPISRQEPDRAGRCA